MLKDVIYPPSKSYHTDSENPVLKFYLDILPEIKTLDLELGYFSSGAISVLAIGMAQFIQNGGVLRIISNESISESDSDLIFGDSVVAEDKPEYIADTTKLDELKEILQNREKHFYNCLRYLKDNNRLTIQPVKPIGSGIAHNKIGLISDGENELYFSGSANFTGNALIHNSESIDISLDWTGDTEATRVKINDFKSRFQKLISQEHSNYKYLNKSELDNYVKDKSITKSLDELLSDSFDLKLTSREKTYSKKLSEELKKKNEEFKAKVEKIKTEPKFPFPSGPREYQREAYQAWLKNDKKGIFAMATGTGKTITALNCVLEEYHKSNNYRLVILVPTTSLVNQWKEEAESFNFKNIITVSANSKWESKVSSVSMASKLRKGYSFVIITTYASFHRPRFQSYFKRLPINTTLIADEAHNMGATKLLELLPNIHLNDRIGLSATPKRVYDDFSNKKIEDFFNDKPPFVYNYSMKEAIEKGVLTQYEYFPHVVFLKDFELNEYTKISIQLQKWFDPKTGSYKKNQVVEALLLKRKRIIHKAIEKKEVFEEIVNEEYKNRGNLNYSLVYVPEGVEPKYDEIEELLDSEDDLKLIDEYTRTVSSVDKSVTVSQFTGATKNKPEILNFFSLGKTDVLTSMKCLDEGVDIPRTELAFFCSSTGNPRQFIQRRGRILRKHKDKSKAVIHDLIVVPKLFNDADSTYEMEKGLVKRELSRVVNFAFLSMNKYHTVEKLEYIYRHYGLSLFEIEDELNKIQ